MQNLLKKSHRFNSTKQQKPSLSRNISSGLEYAAKVYSHGEDSESQSPEQDFSLTLSTCQSHHAMFSMARNKSCMHGVLSEPSLGGIYGSRVESCLRSFLPSDNADYAIHQAQLDFSQSTACISYPWSESYFSRIIAAYGPNAVIYPQSVGMTPQRVLLPTQCTESFPLFVNAKQYPAILRRRKIRAKLEAQNKLAKSRKPYLHESRHLHAQRRARGSSGRFLNTKIMPHPKPPSSTSVTYKSHQQLSNVSRSEVQHSTKQQLETSTLSSSDITTIFNGYDIFQHTERNAPWEGFSSGKT